MLKIIRNKHRFILLDTHMAVGFYFYIDRMTLFASAVFFLFLILFSISVLVAAAWQTGFQAGRQANRQAHIVGHQAAKDSVRPVSHQ